MEHLTTTPFGRRPVTAGLIAQVAARQSSADPSSIDKWGLFRDLCAARAAFGVTDRDLAVLNALLSFHPAKELNRTANLIVFPSNLSLSERTHGMAESTLRRHLAALIKAGLIARHDSPNGKRYARRKGNTITRAFGFDLRPLLALADEITSAAETAREDLAQMKLAREAISLRKRDALKLAIYGQENALPGAWDALMARLMEIHKLQRRKLDLGQLCELDQTLEDILREIHTMLGAQTEEMDGNDSENERHYQNSDKDSFESEPAGENAPVEGGAPNTGLPVQIPLSLVIRACPDIRPYCEAPVRDWHDLVRVSGQLRGMMGISLSAWETAQRDMSAPVAATVIACMLQRFTHIRNPGGYLRHLSNQAREGVFSAGPMVMALLNSHETSQ
jgi:replication initiation protein RepC